MKTSAFNYQLPPELIAQTPAQPRDSSRLLVLDKKTKKIKHCHFFNLPLFLKKGDVLVLNNSKVFPARLLGYKQATRGAAEIFLLSQLTNNSWEGLVKGKGQQPGKKIIIVDGRQKKQLTATLIKKTGEYTWEISFDRQGKALSRLIAKIGHTPLPPYIKKESGIKNYQTVYAKNIGSAAAPTAGLHFTPRLLKQLKKQGVQIEYITLHVGLGTFQPVKTETIEEHQMHAELATIDSATADRLNLAKQKGERIIAVGTTTIRTLETFVKNKKIQPQTSWISTFIYPPYKFKFVDAIITNFHLPQSTLLMLISAFASRGLILKAYRVAIKKKYRFFSFGDAMLIK